MRSEGKFKSLVRYVCSRRADAPDTLGAVKLNKILWLADLSAFYELGAPITSSRYIKHKFGPVPARILPALKALQEEGVLTIREADHFGKRKKQYLVNVRSEGELWIVRSTMSATSTPRHRSAKRLTITSGRPPKMVKRFHCIPCSPSPERSRMWNAVGLR
jgi:hypothetical protein